jgi:hypothetical protein
MMSVAGTELNRLVLFLSVPEGNGEERAGGSGGGPAGGQGACGGHRRAGGQEDVLYKCGIGVINLFNNNQC